MISPRVVPLLFVLCLPGAACGGDGITEPARLRFTSLTAGDGSACGLTDGGRAFCWGLNSYGQLGMGDLEFRLIPTAMPGAPRFATLDQRATSCAVDLLGHPYCWGLGDYGNLGTGSLATGGVPLPQGVLTTARFRQVSSWGSVTCGLTEAGAAYCWGRYDGGRLGVGAIPDGSPLLQRCRPRFSSQYYFEDGRCASVPVPVAGGHTFRNLSVGREVCGITSEAVMLCWGDAYAGVGAPIRLAPTQVQDAPPLAQIASGGEFTCGLTDAGKAYCWGEAYDSDFSSTVPVAVGADLTLSTIAVGRAHACGATPGGTAYCWGSNATGALGDGTREGRPGQGELLPVFVSGGLRFRSLAAGADFTCGITTDDEGYCWGANGAGQLGDGTLSARLVPTRIQMP